MKVIFTPISIITGLIAGIIGKRIFQKAWAVVDDEEAPKPQHREISWPKLVSALLVEGAIFSLVKGLVNHGTRTGFARLTGKWPGEERPEVE